jgi:hypothetical protein
MKKLFIVILSSLTLASCGNPLGDAGTFIDQGHTPGVDKPPVAIPPSGSEFNPIKGTYEVTSGGRFKVSAAVNTTDKPAVLTQSGRYKVYSTVQGQIFSAEDVR